MSTPSDIELLARALELSELYARQIELAIEDYLSGPSPLGFSQLRAVLEPDPEDLWDSPEVGTYPTGFGACSQCGRWTPADVSVCAICRPWKGLG